MIACVNNSLFSNYSHTFQISFAFNQDNYHMLGGLTKCHGCLQMCFHKKVPFPLYFIILTFPIKYKIQSKCHFPLKDLSEKNNFMLHISYSGNSVFHFNLTIHIFFWFLIMTKNGIFTSWGYVCAPTCKNSCFESLRWTVCIWKCPFSTVLLLIVAFLCLLCKQRALHGLPSVISIIKRSSNALE